MPVNASDRQVNASECGLDGKFGVFHDTPECLGEQCSPETSLTHQAFPWACPKCFKKGKAVLETTLLGPAKKKRGR